MDKKQALEKSLQELKRATGLNLDLRIEDEDGIEETITQIRYLANAYKEKFNKNYVLRQWLKGEINDSDMFEASKRLHIPLVAKRILYLISVNSIHREEIITILKNMYPYRSNIWIVELDAGKILLIQKIERNDGKYDKLANEIIDTLRSEAMVEVKIAYSHLVETLEEVPNAYKEASFVLEVGNTFQYEENVFGFDRLGVGRLLHTIPNELCQDYLFESLKRSGSTDDIQSFQPEILKTVNCFLDNNLNIAETARQLHVHRNTLIYRLDQIEKEIGLDVRQFNHAMTYKIASLVMQKIVNKGMS